MTNCAPGGAYNFVMDIIYIDRLFLLNLVLDYLIVLCSARLLRNKAPTGKVRRRCRFRRALRRAQSASGTCFLKLWPVKLICGLLMALIAFGSEDKLCRCCLTFFCRFRIIRRSCLGNIAAKRRKLRLGSIHTCFASGAYFCRLRLSTPF